MKKIVIIGLCLVFALAITFSAVISVSAEQSQVEKIVNFAKSKIGSTEYVGLCQAFVYQCYKAAGIDNGSASSAIAAWNKWGVSTSKDNIPIGACVYFNENVGSQYGHVGIYIGNNKMIHSRQSVGKVVESSMAWYFENCYLGWGWQGGVQPSSNALQDSNNDTADDYYKLTAPDGFQTIRSSYSTSASKVYDIILPAIVCVTKYSPDGKWGYINYSGKSGWIRLYYVEKHSHSYGSWQTTKAATCTETGTQKQSCACGLSKTSTIAALGHNYSNEYTLDNAATCTQLGSKSKHCTRCSSKTNVTVIETLEHTFSMWETTKNATCISNGEKKRYCSVCSLSEIKTILTSGHDFSSEWTYDKKSTCTDFGSKSHHCLNCDAKTDLTNISPIGHAFGEWQKTKEPTTKTNGEAQRKCKNSGCAEFETKTIAKLAEDGHTHKFGDWEIKEKTTCTQNGQNVRKCSICSEIESIIVLSKGHDFDNWQTEKQASCEEDGVIVRVCKNCNDKEIDKISHTGHTFGEAVVNKEGTENETGIKTSTCIVCGETKEEIPYLTAEPETPDDEKTDSAVDTDNKDGGNNILWIIVIAALVVIGGAVAAVIIIKKKKVNIAE